MKQDIERQYDDDLTVGTDEYDDSYYTDADDLFDFSTNNESPISRLKSLVLSIDWEITDEVLLQFNEELIDLKGIWAGNNINLVYVQALEKISKYIYQNKANSHPNSIKLLLTLYYNLEKIVSSTDLSEAEKKEILLEDVKRFEALKRQISQKTPPVQAPQAPRPPAAKAKKEAAPEDQLLNLKAIVLGIDWEITDQELNNLRREVVRLEELFAGSRPKLILLQGIGTLGAYIKTKKSNAHADAFKVLHLFYESLEKIVKSSMSLAEEKAILFPAVEKFNAFKALLGPTISPEAIGREEDDDEDEEFEGSGAGEIAPALADVTDEEIGFQAEEEAKSLGIDSPEGVSSHIDDFFGERDPSGVAGGEVYPAVESGELLAKEEVTAGFADAAGALAVDKVVALQGVDVGSDDEDEDAEEYGPAAVAALADADEDAVSEWKDSKGTAEEAVLAIEDEQPLASGEEIAEVADSLFPDADSQVPATEFGGVDRDVALQGVNVETEADEDSDELSLPMEGEEVAPALVASEEESLFSAKTLEIAGIGDDISGTLDDLFLEEDQFSAFAAPETATEEDLESEVSRAEALEVTEKIEAEPFAEVAGISAEEPVDQTAGHPEIAEADRQPELTGAFDAKEDEATEAIQEEEDLSLFFAGSELESAEASAAVDSLFESLEPALLEEEEEPVSGEIGEPAEPLFVQEVQPKIELEVPAATFDEVPAEEEISFAEEEISPAEEIAFLEDEASPVEEELSLFEEEPVSPGDEDIESTISLAEEDILLEEPPAGEEILSFEDTDLKEEFSFTEEAAPAEEVPSVTLEEEETELIETEISFAEEETPAFEEELSPAVELPEEVSPVFETSPVEEEISIAAEEEERAETDTAASLPPAEDLSTIVAASPAEEIMKEEEVVFELADDSEAEPVAAQPVAPVPEEPDFAFTEEVEEIAEDLSPAFLEAVQDEESVSFAFTGDTGGSPGEPLAGLRGCIESLGIELNDRIISGTFQEINELRQKWSNLPLEKTFLQLLSTITQHIDRYRFEASSEAHNLLLSVFNALSARRDDDMSYNQELLLMETLKVLEWQQGMLTRQAVQKGSELTFAAPVRTEEEGAESVVDAQQDFDELLQQYEDSPDEVDFSAGKPLEAMAEPQPGPSREFLAADLKQEIDSLRVTLQKEIAELRNELKGK